ncbi:MAG: hypothetical protein Q8Q09_21375 [Deltaproteobacteria bacterium]|nr:hypothetical protein [Deltaproteobacteria bacterium]
MSATTTTLWDFLLRNLRSTRQHITAQALAQLDEAAVQALLGQHVIERARTTLWVAPDCLEVCEPAIRHEDQQIYVACPNEPSCWHGERAYASSVLESFVLDRARALQWVAKVNQLAPLRDAMLSRVDALGVLTRRNRKTLVLLARGGRYGLSDQCLGAMIRHGADGVIVLVDPSVCEHEGALSHPAIVALYPAADAQGSLGLYRGLDLLDPSYRARRVTDPEALYDDVRLRFATTPDEHHSVRFNQEESKGFSQSDQRFLRLLRLALARCEEPHESGGWLPRYELCGTDNEKDVADLREALRNAPLFDLSPHERESLLKVRKGEGLVRLAIQAENIHVDASVGRLVFLSQPNESEAPTRSGSTHHRRSIARGHAVAVDLWARCQRAAARCTQHPSAQRVLSAQD